jgi:palmitoyltransferase
MLHAFGLCLTAVVYFCHIATAVVTLKYSLFLWWYDPTEPAIAGVPLTMKGLVLAVMHLYPLGMAFVAHIATMLTDAGYIPKGECVPPSGAAPGARLKSCAKCDGWKPPRAHHCRVCNRCVFRMDHHCPWVNNCVGFGNQKLFILFMCYVAIAAVSTICIHIAGFYNWYAVRNMQSPAGGESPVLAISLCVVVVLMCAGFLCFVFPFLSDQHEAIVQNSTLVETFQETHGERTDFWSHLAEVMGTDWRWWWVPVPSGVVPNYLERVISDREADERIKPEVKVDEERDLKREAKIEDEQGVRYRGGWQDRG